MLNRGGTSGGSGVDAMVVVVVVVIISSSSVTLTNLCTLAVLLFCGITGSKKTFYFLGVACSWIQLQVYQWYIQLRILGVQLI